MSYIFIYMTLYMTNSPAVKKNRRDFSPLGGFPFGHLGVSPASRLRVHCVHCVSCEPDTGVREEPLLLQYRVVALVPRAFHSTYFSARAPVWRQRCRTCTRLGSSRTIPSAPAVVPLYMVRMDRVCLARVRLLLEVGEEEQYVLCEDQAALFFFYFFFFRCVVKSTSQHEHDETAWPLNPS